MVSRRWQSLTLIALGWIMTACGQKGPPLAPLHLVPASVSEPTARRIGDKVRLRFVLPNRNENGPGRLELDRVEIYAMTVGPDGEPSAGEVMSEAHVIGQIPVRPLLEEGQEHAPGESRPEPGTPVTFDEDLTAAKLKPEPVKTPAKPAVPQPGAAAAVPPAAGAPAPPTAAPPAPTAAPPAPPTAAPPAPPYGGPCCSPGNAATRDRRGSPCHRRRTCGSGCACSNLREAHLHGARAVQARPAGSRVATVVYSVGGPSRLAEGCQGASHRECLDSRVGRG